MTVMSKNIALNIAKIIDDKKGQNIRVLDIQEISSFADFFVIANGNSTRQVKAIVDAIEDKMKELEIYMDHKEGYDNGRWVLLDYLTVVVHIFLEEERQFYNIDRVWKDASQVIVDSI